MKNYTLNEQNAFDRGVRDFNNSSDSPPYYISENPALNEAWNSGYMEAANLRRERVKSKRSEGKETKGSSVRRYNHD